MAVLVPCAAAADQHALPIKFCTIHGMVRILVFALDCLESQGQIPRCMLFVQRWLTVSCLCLFSTNVLSVDHIFCCRRLQPQANAWLQRGLFH